MDRSNHHRVAQVEESDAMKTMMMTLMEKFDAFSSSSPRETLSPLVQEQQGVQEVNYMGGTSSYNPNFKSHENFSYANQRAAVQFPPGFNPGAKPPNNEGRPSQDDAMEAMFKKMDEFMKGTSSHIKSLEQQMGTQIKTLEHQMGQLASTMGEQHQKEGIVQEEKEEVNEDPVEEEEELELAKEDEEDKGMGTEKEKKKEQEKMKKKVEEEVRVPKCREAKDKKQDTKEVELDHWGVPKTVVPPPFPQRFMKKKMDEKFSKFLENKCHIMQSS
ncbi:hypothetical protein ACS0TY_024068 [Phlomoides rotata]